MALDRVRLSFDLFISGFVSTTPSPVVPRSREFKRTLLPTDGKCL